MLLAEQYIELQEKYPRVDVEKVLARFRQVKRREPSTSELEFWIANEKNPAMMREDVALQAKPAHHYETEDDKRRARECRQCEGSGFVKVARLLNGRMTPGPVFTTYYDKDGEQQRKLIRCDHQTQYVDHKQGQEPELEAV